MKRVCDLKPGDRFYWMGVMFRCFRVTDKVWIRRLDSHGVNSGNPIDLSLKNQMWVELHGSYTQKVNKIHSVFIGERG